MKVWCSYIENIICLHHKHDIVGFSTSISNIELNVFLWNTASLRISEHCIVKKETSSTPTCTCTTGFLISWGHSLYCWGEVGRGSSASSTEAGNARSPTLSSLSWAGQCSSIDITHTRFHVTIFSTLQQKTKDGPRGNGTAFKKCGGTFFGGSERWCLDLCRTKSPPISFNWSTAATFYTNYYM